MINMVVFVGNIHIYIFYKEQYCCYCYRVTLLGECFVKLWATEGL